jgi:hypothetical protein
VTGFEVFRIDCKSKSAFSKRDWQGMIIGKSLHGSLNALCTRIGHKYKSAPLVRLLTFCIRKMIILIGSLDLGTIIGHLGRWS